MFTKPTKNQSSRRQIAIKGVRDDVLLLPGNRYRMVLQVSSINFELKSEAEQDSVIDNYQSFLNSLSTPLQILVRVREMDMDKYMADFKQQLKDERLRIYREQIKNYTQFIKTLVTTNKILSRQFFLIIPYDGTEKDFTLVHEQLALSTDMVAKGLARLGMQARRLDSLEILDLFYSFYNPKLAKIQPLSAQTLQAMAESYL